MKFKSSLLWTRCDDVSGTVALDDSGNSNNGIYEGTFTLNQDGLLKDNKNSTEESGSIKCMGSIEKALSKLKRAEGDETKEVCANCIVAKDMAKAGAE